MSAFKVLNLRTVSSRVIMMLGFSGGSAPPLFELALIISYLAFGDFFLSVYLLKSKDKTVMIILCSLLFFIELIFNFTFFFFKFGRIYDTGICIHPNFRSFGKSDGRTFTGRHQ